MIGIFWQGKACEYTNRKHLVGDTWFYEYRAQEGAIEDTRVFSERAPENIYLQSVLKVNTFRGLEL